VCECHEEIVANIDQKDRPELRNGCECLESFNRLQDNDFIIRFEVGEEDLGTLELDAKLYGSLMLFFRVVNLD